MAKKQKIKILDKMNIDEKVWNGGFNLVVNWLRIFINIILGYMEGSEFKFHLTMQRIAIQYILNTFSEIFVWLKPCSTKNYKVFVKYLFWLI